MSERDPLHQHVFEDIPAEMKAAIDQLPADDPTATFVRGSVMSLLHDQAKYLFEVRQMVIAGFKANEHMLDGHEERLKTLEDLDLGDSQLTSEDAELFQMVCIALETLCESVQKTPGLTQEQTQRLAESIDLAKQGLARLDEIALPDDDDEDDDGSDDEGGDDDSQDDGGDSSEAPEPSQVN